MFILRDTIFKNEVLKKAYKLKFTVHPESTKMSKDLKEYYWWPNIKREIAEYIVKCGIC